MSDPNSSALTLQTIVAVRDVPESAWRILALACEAGDVLQEVVKLGLAASEKRFLGTSRVAKAYWDSWVIGNALRRGWHRDEQGGAWFPIEEPFPLPSGSPVLADVTLSLTSIMWGSIEIAIEVNGERHTVYLCDLHDELVVFIRFIQLLLSGGKPHAALADRAMSHFIVQEGPQPHQCRLHLRLWQDGQRERRIDAMTNRRKLTDQFIALAKAIGDHPNLAHHFICHCCLPDAEYERADKRAEEEWDRHVAEGRLLNDFDARDQFTASRIVAEVPLPLNCEQLAEQYRTMLRTLEIPREWMVCHGLASM